MTTSEDGCAGRSGAAAAVVPDVNADCESVMLRIDGFDVLGIRAGPSLAILFFLLSTTQAMGPVAICPGEICVVRKFVAARPLALHFGNRLEKHPSQWLAR